MIGQRIKDLREERGLKQIELAGKMKVSTSALSDWESGKRKPDHDSLIILADFFDVTTDYILGREDEFGDRVKG